MIDVRLARAEDAAAIAAIYGPFVRDTWVSFEEDVPDAREMANRIEAARGRFPWVVADDDGAIAGIALPNDASIGFHRAMGFTPVGTYHDVGYKAGAWHDVMWLERELAPRLSPPAEPLSFNPN